VVVQPDGVVRRLDPDTGAPRWDAATGVSGAHPAVLDGERILLAGTGLAELDAATGRVLWAAEDAPRCLAPPAPAGRLVLTSEQDGRLCARERGTGRRAWCRGVGGLPAAPAADARRAYVGTTDRRVLALDLKDGAIDWRFKVGADVGAAPALAGGRVLVAAFDAVLYALGAGNGHMQWRAPLPSRPLSGPLLVGDSVLVACHETELVGFDGRTGRALGSLRAPAELRTGPLLVGDRAYLGLRDRSLVALTLDMTPAKDLPLGRPAARPPRRQRERSLNP
jgi:outer membrane protein assembly factor BamB